MVDFCALFSEKKVFPATKLPAKITTKTKIAVSLFFDGSLPVVLLIFAKDNFRPILSKRLLLVTIDSSASFWRNAFLESWVSPDTVKPGAGAEFSSDFGADFKASDSLAMVVVTAGSV